MTAPIPSSGPDEVCHPEHQDVRGSRGRWRTRQNPQRTLDAVGWGVWPGTASESLSGGASPAGRVPQTAPAAAMNRFTGPGGESPEGGSLRDASPGAPSGRLVSFWRPPWKEHSRCGSLSSGAHAERAAPEQRSGRWFTPLLKRPVASCLGVTAWRDVASRPV